MLIKFEKLRHTICLYGKGKDMKVLVINCGSSSLKYQLINMENENVLAKGLVERIGIEGSILKHETTGREKELIKVPMENHKVALKLVLEALVNEDYGAIASMEEIAAVGHRVVHGGEQFASSCKLNDTVIKALEDCIELAPLHNPPNLVGIEACREILPDVPMVAVFDTSFHQTMPKEAFLYGLPYEYYEKYRVRRYGFHGTSHRYVTMQAAKLLNKNVEDVNLITCHLGNGASLAAIKGGKSIDTSMGFTPLEGLIMGTRCGDIDPAIIPYIMEKENMSLEDVNNMMNKKSGVLGVSGVSSDFRDIEAEVKKGNEIAVAALETFRLRVKKYIGAYAAELGHVDGIVFTAGLGENSGADRAAICAGLEPWGIFIDGEANTKRGEEIIITTPESKIAVMVIPTNEELMIARDTMELIK